MNILAVIPARGNSKGISRKNMRMMNGKPLLYYSISVAKSCSYITDIVVTSENDEILNYAERLGVTGLQRDEALSGDVVTLDPVIYNAVVEAERRKRKKYDYVITLQPTSPLLKQETLSQAIEQTLEQSWDTMISAVNKPLLSWKMKGDSVVPNYQERLNRQQLPAHYIETGAFVISRRNVISPCTRIGQAVTVFEIPERQGIDIDTSEDWSLCESLLKRKKILFRTDGYTQLGMGHIYRCLTLAYVLTEHEVLFACNKKHRAGIEKIKSCFFPCYEIEGEESFYQVLEETKPDIVVHDLLDSEEQHMKKIKHRTRRLVTFEDLGTGTEVADAVINALYPNKDVRTHVYTGHKYVCLRDEFLLEQPKDFEQEVKNVFIMFGGSDPLNMTKKLYSMIYDNSHSFKGIVFNFITGLAYDNQSNYIVDCPDKNIFVYNNTNKVSWYMKQADIAFTSQGRSVFELASLGVPSIVMAQNKREQQHSFASLENGFLNLGLGMDISEKTLLNTLHWLIDTPQIRRDMRKLMLDTDLKPGIFRVKKIILDYII